MTIEDILTYILSTEGPFVVSEQSLYDFIKGRGEYKLYLESDPDTLTIKIGVEEVNDADESGTTGG